MFKLYFEKMKEYEKFLDLYENSLDFIVIIMMVKLYILLSN